MSLNSVIVADYSNNIKTEHFTVKYILLRQNTGQFQLEVDVVLQYRDRRKMIIPRTVGEARGAPPLEPKTKTSAV